MCDGQEAIDFYKNESKNNHQFSLIITDLTIPGGMGGAELLIEIRKLNKDIPVFVISGYSHNSVMNDPIKHGFTASISKPFTIAELSDLLQMYLTA